MCASIRPPWRPSSAPLIFPPSQYNPAKAGSEQIPSLLACLVPFYVS